MNDNLIFMGINAPRAHQAVITRLIYGLTDLYLDKKTTLFPYPETMINEGETSPVPDVMLVDPATDLVKMLIEINHTQGIAKDVQKVKKLMEEYAVPEGFTYDYKLKKWLKLQLNDLANPTPSSFSDLIQADLQTFLA